MMNDVQKNFNQLIVKKEIRIFKDKTGMFYVSIGGKQVLISKLYDAFIFTLNEFDKRLKTLDLLFM